MKEQNSFKEMKSETVKPWKNKVKIKTFCTVEIFNKSKIQDYFRNVGLYPGFWINSFICY